MEVVKRYDHIITDGYYGAFSEMQESKDGHYILYSDYEKLKAQLEKAEAVISFYGDIENYKDTLKEIGKESPHFKYFYKFRNRSDDFENLSTDGNYHFYAGKRAREYFKEKGE